MPYNTPAKNHLTHAQHQQQQQLYLNNYQAPTFHLNQPLAPLNVNQMPTQNHNQNLIQSNNATKQHY